jgi:hypothetical protein
MRLRIIMNSFEWAREYAQAITGLGQPLKRGTAGEYTKPLGLFWVGRCVVGLKQAIP